MKGMGQSFDEFMVEQGLYDEAKELAVKKIVFLTLLKILQNFLYNTTQK
jgi:hypothetical protein